MISRLTIRRLVLISTITTLVSLGLMVMGIVYPRPLLLVLAMSLGQLFGTLSLALYLLAIVLDLQGVGEHDDIGPHIGLDEREDAREQKADTKA